MREEHLRLAFPAERCEQASREDHQVVEGVAVRQPHIERVVGTVRDTAHRHARGVDAEHVRDPAERHPDVADVFVEARDRLSPRDIARLGREHDHAVLFSEREGDAHPFGRAAEAVQHDEQRRRDTGLVRHRHVDRAVAFAVGNTETPLPRRQRVARHRHRRLTERRHEVRCLRPEQARPGGESECAGGPEGEEGASFHALQHCRFPACGADGMHGSTRAMPGKPPPRACQQRTPADNVDRAAPARDRRGGFARP